MRSYLTNYSRHAVRLRAGPVGNLKLLIRGGGLDLNGSWGHVPAEKGFASADDIDDVSLSKITGWRVICLETRMKSDGLNRSQTGWSKS